MMKLSQKEEEEEEEKAINMDKCKYINEKRLLYLTNLERLSYRI